MLIDVDLSGYLEILQFNLIFTFTKTSLNPEQDSENIIIMQCVPHTRTLIALWLPGEAPFSPASSRVPQPTRTADKQQTMVILPFCIWMYATGF